MTFTFERRLATFKELKWPHTSNKKYKSQPEDFAQAGFYFRPMAGSDDTVSCYLCFKSLDGWQSEDCAWLEHRNHSAPCPLVTLNLVQSRLRTFDKWPGAKVKGGVRALAESGFYYLPKDDVDDTCTCYQCGLSLDGWETDDDPLYEHSRRRPNCPHIVNQEYVKPASFEFILANQPDNLAICDINERKSPPARPIPQTPIRRQAPVTQSTIKSKKIRISVPQSGMKQATATAINIASSSTKTPQSSRPTPQLNKLKIDLINLFPSLKDQQDAILNWTMEELFEQLIKEKVGMFRDFLNRNNDENEGGKFN